MRRNRSGTEIDQKKRSLAKAGLATPIVLTLASRPALAKQCSPSVMASGNLSDPVDLSTCGTCTNQQWLQAKQNDFAACGISDPANTPLGQIFSIPAIHTPSGAAPIISGNLFDALQGNCAVPSSLQFVNSHGGPIFPQSAGQDALNELMCYALTAVLNGLNPTTSTNITYLTNDVINAVNSVLVVTSNKKIDADQLTLVRQYCLTLMSDGSSCALS